MCGLKLLSILLGLTIGLKGQGIEEVIVPVSNLANEENPQLQAETVILNKTNAVDEKFSNELDNLKLTLATLSAQILNLTTSQEYNTEAIANSITAELKAELTKLNENALTHELAESRNLTENLKTETNLVEPQVKTVIPEDTEPIHQAEKINTEIKLENEKIQNNFETMGIEINNLKNAMTILSDHISKLITDQQNNFEILGNIVHAEVKAQMSKLSDDALALQLAEFKNLTQVLQMETAIANFTAQLQEKTVILKQSMEENRAAELKDALRPLTEEISNLTRAQTAQTQFLLDVLKAELAAQMPILLENTLSAELAFLKSFTINQTLQTENFDRFLQIKLEAQIAPLIENAFSAKLQELRNLTESLKPKPATSKPIEAFDRKLNFIDSDCGDSDKLPEDCVGALQQSPLENGVFALKTNDRDLQPFGVYCLSHETEAWTVIQRRQNGAVDFFRNWDSYKNGFGDLNGDYWLGLDRIHALTTKAQQKLWIQMKTDQNETLNAYYNKFQITDEGAGYRLKVNSFHGRFHDALKSQNGKKFSTFDKNNEIYKISDKNCANNFQSGWWFSYCGECNLNGEFKTRPSAYSDEGLWWSRGYNSYYSLQYIHMAIRAA